MICQVSVRLHLSLQQHQWQQRLYGTGFQFGFLPAEEATSELNRPSEDETMLVICGRLHRGWEEEDYPEWAFQRNVAWLVEEEQGRTRTDDDAPWSRQLRLDSRFFTYCVQREEEEGAVIRMSEIFRVKRGPLMRQEVGRWAASRNNGKIDITESSLWERRTDLGGAELVETVLAWEPFMILGGPDGNSSSPSSSGLAADGLMVDLLRILQGSSSSIKPLSSATTVVATTGQVDGLVGNQGTLPI